MRRLAFFACVLVLAGCGGEGGGTATLWVTRDRGAHVLLTATVPAGLTAMQALQLRADVSTRYGGRFVVAINDVTSRSHFDWFYYVNGIPVDRSAAEYRLHDGDVEWWDFTEWRRPNEVVAVVGAFPEPFVHGLDGKVPDAVVVGAGPVANALAKLIHGRVEPKAPPGARVLELRAGSGFQALTQWQFVIDPALAVQLVENPSAFRYRYSVP